MAGISQALSAYATFGLLASTINADPAQRNNGNMLPSTVMDGQKITLLVSYPMTGPDGM